MGATSKILGLFWQFDVLQCNFMDGCYKRKKGQILRHTSVATGHGGKPAAS